MAIQLTPELQEQVEELLATGNYRDAEAVLARSLELLSEREQLARLRELVQVGLDQADRGDTEPYTPELRARIRDAARQRALAGERPGPDVQP